MINYEQLFLFLRTMDFAALQVFQAVAKTGGISAAAKQLHRVQSNVTTRIQQLEASLGIQLFVRDKGRLHLSAAGALFLNYTDEILQLSQKARDALSGDVPHGVLRIGTLESTAGARLPSLLSRYHKKYPAVRVELMTGTTDALVEAVTNRFVEAAFVAECTTRPQLEMVPVYIEELVLIAPKTHPKVKHPRDVNANTIISFPPGCAYRRLLQTWLGSGSVVPDKVLELSSYHAIVACVASGTGVAFVPRSVLKTISGAKEVAVYELGRNKGKAVTSLIWRKGESSSPLRALQAEVVALKKLVNPHA